MRGEKVEQKITAIPRGCDSARVEQVIVTRALKGAGTENDPCREVIQYWTLDGELIVTRSQYEEGQSNENVQSNNSRPVS